ncbi:hypothetical protein BDM02DRAFT_3133232 [Thelephora ganbajun]|uniref:Uncharacterized protein n=1 Tax=Thelephora ganbajun TaxID=370292 RepID=A0ACB6YY65_THEGA|nr:hypothetical protein BDM02DRAFT_3133232 [Thelephora ganbajun]
MSRAEAEEYRLELMDERTVFVEASDSNYFGQEFNMCNQPKQRLRLRQTRAENGAFQKTPNRYLQSSILLKCACQFSLRTLISETTVPVGPFPRPGNEWGSGKRTLQDQET